MKYQILKITRQRWDRNDKIEEIPYLYDDREVAESRAKKLSFNHEPKGGVMFKVVGVE